MFVCLCFGVTDTEIVDAVRQGHDTVSKINRELGAAGCCGSCSGTIEALIDRQQKAEKQEEILYQAAAG